MGLFSTLFQLVGSIGKKKEQPVAADGSPRQYRKWRLTYYLIADQAQFSGPRNVPIFDETGKTILAMVEPGFFSYASLQGTGKLRSANGNKLLNVAKFVPVKHENYAGVLAYHKEKLAKRDYGYSGLVVEDGRVVKAMSFSVVPDDRIGKGYGVIRGVAHDPFRTLAGDIGTAKRAEPKYKGKGGLVPAHTKVHIKEFVGVNLPDGTVHDGWFEVIDSGGGIFGAHFDVFVGNQILKDKVKIPGTANIWFEGIEQRVPIDYLYGLKDI